MEGNRPYITNLVNSIIGVSVLAMPYCLKQCGIVLGLGLLFCAAWLTYLSCSMLASSAFHKRRRTYEYLALYTLGPTGKFAVELSMIGLMLGTCVAFYVVIGDLSYGTIAKLVPGADPYTLRLYTIIFTALCIALPLGNMKNLSILSYFGAVSLIFYMCFLVVVIVNAVSNGLLQLEWWDKVTFWRPAGIFQCLPIFSLAYACQCQLFIVYASLEEPTVGRVEDIVFGAIRFVTVAYMSIGFFGYTTYREAIAGNLLLNFPSNYLLDCIKMGFALSVVLGFPLMISPCRQSIHTLIFAQPVGEGMQSDTYIPPFLFKSITLAIVLLTMTIAIVIPNVETILGLTGATMGSIICFIFPALIYEKAHAKASGNTPKFVFVLGCILLVVCTYSNLSKITDPTIPENPIEPNVPDVPDLNMHDIGLKNEDDLLPIKKEEVDKQNKENMDEEPVVQPKAVVEGDDHRHEPPNPIEPDNQPNFESQEKSNEKLNEHENVVEKEDDHALVNVDTKNDSPKEEIKVEPPPAPKEEEKEVPAVERKEEVEKPKSPVLKSNPPVQQHVIDSQRASDKKVVVNPNLGNQDSHVNVNHRVDSVNNQLVVDPAQRLSPKIIKKDEVKPQQKVTSPPVLLQGNPLNEQHINHGPMAPKTQPPIHEMEHESKDEEKELLEKIKEQHGMQQKLLIEQEQLIKKLEEQQDKKDQAGEENELEEAVGIQQNAKGQGDADQQKPMKNVPENLNVEHKESIVNIPIQPQQVQHEVMMDGLNRQRQGNDMPKDTLDLHNGDKVNAGRELLSEDKAEKPDNTHLNNVEAGHSHQPHLQNIHAANLPVGIPRASATPTKTKIFLKSMPSHIQRDLVQKNNIVNERLDQREHIDPRQFERNIGDPAALRKTRDLNGADFRMAPSEMDLENEKLKSKVEDDNFVKKVDANSDDMDDDERLKQDLKEEIQDEMQDSVSIQEEEANVQSEKLDEESDPEDENVNEDLPNQFDAESDLNNNNVGLVVEDEDDDVNIDEESDHKKNDEFIEGCQEGDSECLQRKVKSRELKSLDEKDLR